MNEQNKADTLIKKLTGRIYNETGMIPLPGVTILLKGTDIETSTDNDGKFSLIIKNPSYNDTIQFFFVGYHLTERSAFSQDFTIFMNPEFEDLVDPPIVGMVIRKFPRNIWWRIKNVFR